MTDSSAVSLGIDFGTTNSTVSFCDADGSVRMLDIDEGPILRSVLFFDPERQVHYGKEALSLYAIEGADGRFMRSIKTFLPSPSFTGTYVLGKKFLIEDLVALILKTIKKRAEQQLGQIVSSVVLGRPVVFSEDPEIDRLAQDRLLTAAEKAGFRTIHFQLEPIAAALTFEAQLPDNRERIVLVGDFGGGTSDFTIMRLQRDRATTHRRDDVLSVGGLYVGGDTFDSILMWERIAQHFGKGQRYVDSENQVRDFPPAILINLKQWHLVALLRDRETLETIRRIKAKARNPKVINRLEELVTANAGFSLFQAIEAAKCELSTATQASVLYDDICEVVHRFDFEYMIIDQVEKIGRTVEATLSSAALDPAQVEHVFLTGGSSKIPCIRRFFADRFGEEKLCERDAFTSIGYGLGVSARVHF